MGKIVKMWKDEQELNRMKKRAKLIEKLKKKVAAFNELNLKWGNICDKITIRENGGTYGGGIDPFNNSNMNLLELMFKSGILELKLKSIHSVSQDIHDLDHPWKY